MESASPFPDLELDVDAIRARASEALTGDLAAAKRRVIEAERAYAQLLKQVADLQTTHASEKAALVSEKAALVSEKAALASEKAALFNKTGALINENRLLLRKVAVLVTQLANATGRDAQLVLTAEISKLQRQLDDRNRSIYGSTSERRRPSDGSKKDDDKKKKRKKKGTGATRTTQRELPLEHVQHVLTPDQTAQGCSKCSGDLVEIKGQTEDSEVVGVQRIRYVRKAHHRHKYRCSCCGWIRTAPGPDRLVDGSRYSPEFAVQVAVDKYSDALPLSRQVARMKRAGLTVTSATLWDQLQYLYNLLLPTLLVLHQRVLKGEVCVADETPWRMMSNKGGGSKKWWLWTVSDGTGVYFQLVTSRGAEAACELLQNFAGILVTDDYVVYTSLEKARTRNGGVQMIVDEDGNPIEVPTPDYTLATCWMHARRYLFKAERYHPEAGPALDLIDELYKIERTAVAEVEAKVRDSETAVDGDLARMWLLDARRRLRDTRSRRCVRLLDTWREDVLRPDGTALAEATDHLDRLWSRLLLFLDNPKIPLDSGHAERQIRGPVVGRNNYRGCRSAHGAEVAALFFSLISTAKNMGLDPHAYLLVAVTKALRDRGCVFTPWDYAECLREIEAALATEGESPEG